GQFSSGQRLRFATLGRLCRCQSDGVVPFALAVSPKAGLTRCRVRGYRFGSVFTGAACGAGRARRLALQRSWKSGGFTMKIHEYQAKALFREAGIPAPDGIVARTADEAVAAAEQLGLPVVIKAQVHVGGRGKAGGVKLCFKP